MPKKSYDAASLERTKKYYAEHMRQMKLDLNRDTDADVIDYLDTIKNRRAYLLALIREDMKAHAPAQNLKNKATAQKLKEDYTMSNAYTIHAGDIIMSSKGPVRIDGKHHSVYDATYLDFDDNGNVIDSGEPQVLMTEHDVLRAVHEDTGHVFDHIDFIS